MEEGCVKASAEDVTTPGFGQLTMAARFFGRIPPDRIRRNFQNSP